MKFYATISNGEIRSYMPNVPVLLPASSWARTGLSIPRLPLHVTERAADCGGFVATFKWGDYRYTPAQYVQWLDSWLPEWAAMMDYCCEPEVLGKVGIVRERQDKTTAMAYHFWQHYQARPWVWVPTIQGWQVEDYTRHAEEMRPLIYEMAAYYGADSAFRVGIGTLCRRASVAMIHEVVSTVSSVLPDVPLHLWGVKLGLLQAPLALPGQIESIDSAAWNGMFHTGRERWKSSGLSQRRYCLTVALPAYLAKVEKALSTPKQSCLETWLVT